MQLTVAIALIASGVFKFNSGLFLIADSYGKNIIFEFIFVSEIILSFAVGYKY
jgi:hypothetical protein